MKRRTLLVGSLGVLAIPALAKAYFDTGTFNNVAVSGYDPVAYFIQGKAVEGNKKYSTRYKEAEFRFSSQANLDAFVAEPEKYTPQYGGYCAYAVANGYTASTDPEAFSVVNGKLYLNFNKSVRDRWSQDIAGNIAKADANWPGVLN